MKTEFQRVNNERGLTFKQIAERWGLSEDSYHELRKTQRLVIWTLWYNLMRLKSSAELVAIHLTGLTPLIKQITEAALKAELEQHLEEDEQPNRKERLQQEND